MTEKSKFYFLIGKVHMQIKHISGPKQANTMVNLKELTHHL